LSARFCQWSDMSGFCGPSLDRLEWFAQCGPWEAKPSNGIEGARSLCLSMDLRSFDRLLPTSGTPLGRPHDLRRYCAGVRVEGKRRVNRRATDQRLSPGPQTNCPPHRNFDDAVFLLMIADFLRFRKPNRPHILPDGLESGGVAGGGIANSCWLSELFQRAICPSVHGGSSSPWGFFRQGQSYLGGRFRSP
jgi:hypothetical protein